ncbi:MORN motif protein (macronuclear) [Tetrahymena thermophila SB210]|uniref:MORN motif protein n=1 Tax=Tetrahymena thermophila (strain SB210) TaxID=312017 RepID=Q23DJ7_TETTS|nr:MORN motif protein [Tetrahymena thermophila SB210]EAR94333.1 MORN motif protein [Tetrahymena thermophila SB210]|eukprot:XP_001014689.1 MORN motif protein [Tetrahymena thermophila SB210]
MYQLNKRCGFFKKKIVQNDAEKYHYFFISNSGIMYFDQNWFRVRSAINQCKTVEDVEQKLIKEDFKQIDLKKYSISSTISNHQYGDQVPFTNRLCFEITCEQLQYQQLYIFGLSDDTDINELYNYFRVIETTKKDNQENSPNQQVNPPANTANQIEVEKGNQKVLTFFSYIFQQYEQKIDQDKVEKNNEERYLYDIINQIDSFKSNNIPEDQQQQMLELSDQVTYSGQMVNGMPHGIGKEFSNDGIQYEGSYRLGKRHGPGQFVDSNLDMHQYEYIMGRPVGI